MYPKRIANCITDEDVYIVFSSTNSMMGRIIRTVTRNKYNHVSVSFDENLGQLFSFARYCKRAPLAGGFVEESPLRYFDNKPATIKVCRLPVLCDDYNNMKNIVENMRANREKYLYNTFSALLTPINKRVNIKDAYTCIEFADMVLNNTEKISHSDECKSIIALEKELSPYVIYEGGIDNFVNELQGWGNDLYMKKIRISGVFASTVVHFEHLIMHMIKYN